MLYTSQEIADMYSSPNNKITPYVITQNWIKNGLRCIRGKGKGYLFKKEWVEEFLEKRSINVNIAKKTKEIKIRKTKIKNKNVLFVH